MPATNFDFFYDLGSPYSYLASTQLSGIEQRARARPRLVPIRRGGLAKAAGHQIPPPMQLMYMSQDTARWAKRYGVRMQIPQAFPISTIKALRACVAADRIGRQPDAMRALFHTYWADGRDISDASVIEKSLGAADLHRKALAAATQEQESKDPLRRNTARAPARRR